MENLQEKIKVTFVGNSNYARMVAPKYQNNKDCEIRALISSHTEKDILRNTAFEKVPVYRTAEEWHQNLGAPTQKDIFELTVHYPKITPLLDELTAIGARNFVLPKPLAVEKESLEHIKHLGQKYNLNLAIASQWHYSEITAVTKKAIAELKRGEKNLEFDVDYSQFFTDEQLKNYSSKTALIPHVMQIIQTAGLSSFDHSALRLKDATHTNLEFSLEDKDATIHIRSNMKYEGKVRMVKTKGLEADFLAVFDKNGKPQKYASVTYQGKRQEIPEDNLQVMTDTIISAFRNHSSIDNDKKVLTFKRYLPVAQFQVDLEQAIRKHSHRTAHAAHP